MNNPLKKFTGWLISLTVLTGLLFLGLQTFFIWKNSDINQQQLDLVHGKEEERQRKLKEAEDRQKVKDELDRLNRDKARGFNPQNKAKILSHSNIQHLGLRNHDAIKCDDCEKPTLIFRKEVNDHFANILRDIMAIKKGDLLEPDRENDGYSNQLKRNNTVLYGAAGTGKTEFINELAHHLYKQFSQRQIVANDTFPNDIVPPIIEVKGARLQSAGEALGSLNPEQKLIEIIKYYKKQAFGNEFSKEPYIVFIEEADQGVNVMAGAGGKQKFLLEEYKNFLSTSEDKAGLEADAQDPNSIIIIATNNYGLIDPAVVRRGRLGKKLNFNWTPELLEQYGNEGGNNAEWKKINWPQSDPAWKFTGNPNYQDLYKVATVFGYSMFKDEFANTGKANQIIESYKNLSKEKREAKEKELGTIKNEKGEKVCNWLLHFLYTFHYYNANQNLDAFTNAEQIQRYDFGNEFFLQEAIWGVYQQIGQEVTQIGVVVDCFKDAITSLRNIKDLMVETQNAMQQVQQLRNEMSNLEREISSLRSSVNSSLQSVNSMLNGRLSALENKMSSSGSSGSYSSSSGSTSKSKIQQIIGNILSRLSNLESKVSGSEVSNLRNSINELKDEVNSI